MAFISLYGNQLLLNTIFTLDTTNFPAPTSFSVALLTVMPDRNVLNADLVEPSTTVAGSTYITSANVYSGTSYGFAGGTFINYFIDSSNPMSYAFSVGQSVTITNTTTGFNATGIVKNTILTNTNTIAAWVDGASYSINNVATYNGAYFVNLTGNNGTGSNHPDVDTTNWKFVPFCNYTQFTIYVAGTVTGTWSGTGGIVVANTGYSRQSINAGAWSAGQSSVYNDAQIDWSPAYLGWGNIVAWALLDNNNYVLACGELQQPLLVNQNSAVSLPVGSLRLFLN